MIDIEDEKIKIKQAEQRDIPVIEGIYLDVVNWLDGINKSLWSKERISWKGLLREFKLGDFYIAYAEDSPAGCMALVDYDPLIWSEIEKGEALFVHKLAVTRFYAGRGISQEMLRFAVNECRGRDIKSLRLDTDIHREKLMKIYEDFGFVKTGEKTLHIVEQTFDIALYVYDII